MSTWQHSTLPGGLPLVWQERSGPEIVAARLWIRGGSSRDPNGQRGAHQLLAGLLSRGCGKFSGDALADLVEGCGAALRAEATEDSLVISLKCARADAPQLLPLLPTMVTSPWLADDQVELERHLNLQSLQRQLEDPFQLAHDRLRECLYGNGPYGHDPLGIEAELAALGSGELQSLVPSLGPEGALLVLTGSVDLPLRRLLEDQLSHSPWPTQAPAPGAGPRASGQGSYTHLEQDTEQLVLMLGCATVPLGHPDSLLLRLLQSHLGLGMSSRLFVVMREQKGLAYDVGVHMPARRGDAPFIWHLSTSLDRAEEACQALIDEWQRMLEAPLDPSPLALARAKYLGQDAMGRQTCGQLADRQALVLGHGLSDSFIEDSLARAASLNSNELLECAQRWLRQPALSVCGPRAATDAARKVWLSAW